MGRVHLAVEKFFADGGPADLATELDTDAMFAEQIPAASHQKRGAVSQRDEADPHRLDDTGERWRGA